MVTAAGPDLIAFRGDKALIAQLAGSSERGAIARYLRELVVADAQRQHRAAEAALTGMVAEQRPRASQKQRTA